MLVKLFCNDKWFPKSLKVKMKMKTVICIKITRACKCDPLKPHFYIIKFGFAGVYIIFLILALKHRLWVLVRF